MRHPHSQPMQVMGGAPPAKRTKPSGPDARPKIEADVADYLARGGQITVIDSPVPKNYRPVWRSQYPEQDFFNVSR